MRLYYLLLACLSLLLLWEAQDLIKFHSAFPEKSDFSVYYSAVERLLNDSATLYEFEATLNFAGYTYPPLSILLFVPFALFDYYPAFILFQSVIAVALVVAIWCAIRIRQHIFSEQIIDHSGVCCSPCYTCQRPRLFNLSERASQLHCARALSRSDFSGYAATTSPGRLPAGICVLD